MPMLIERHTLSLRPEQRLFSLRDMENDAGLGVSEAIDDARANVAATTGYEIYVAVAQSDLPVSVELQIWDGAPDSNPLEQGWSDGLLYSLPCPSGYLALGRGSSSIGGEWLPVPGRYHAEVYFAGREAAVSAASTIASETAHMDTLEALRHEGQRGAGIERYLILMWYDSPLPDDELDD